MNITILNNIMSITSYSGYEDKMLDFLSNFASKNKYITELSKEYLLVTPQKCGPQKTKTILVVHVDEVGLKISDFISHNKVKIDTIGGMNILTSFGKHIENEDKSFNAIIHPDNESNIYDSNIKIDKLYATSIQPAPLHIKQGELVFFKDTNIITSEYIIGKGLDNKIGIYSCCIIMQSLANLLSNTSVLFTTKEEIQESFYPKSLFDASKIIIVDAMSTIEPESNLFQGPILSFGEKQKKKYEKLVSNLSRKGLNFHVSTFGNKTGTELDLIKNDERYKKCDSFVVSYPVLFMHTCNEIVSVNDVESLITLLKAIVCD